MASLLTLLLLAAAARPVLSACRLSPDSNVVVYVGQGVGPFSNAWTRAFFSWLAAANAGLVVSYAEADDLNSFYDGTACVLADGAAFPPLRLYVQPGGAADNQSAALGPAGRDNLLDFAATARGHYMGTCAGQYFAAGTYWWAEQNESLPGRFFANAWQPHWLPTVEGPLKAIANYPDYAPTRLSNGLTQVYWGGPVRGAMATTATNPDGGEVLSTFADAAVPAGIAATWRYTGAYVRALLNSPHPEAQAGVGLSCAPPLPPGCITEAQQLANWRDLAANINALVAGWAWVIPTSL
jgi:hypothetical protein